LKKISLIFDIEKRRLLASSFLYAG